MKIAQSSAQDIHAFLFCKTTDQTIGKSAVANYGEMRNFCQLLEDATGFPLIDHSLIGNAFTRHRVNSKIEEAKIDSTDIVIVYFSTHGAKSIWDTGISPQVDVPNTRLSSYKIHQDLLKRKPKVLISIIEACSGYMDIQPQQAFLLEQSLVAPENNLSVDVIKGKIINLFNNTCSLLICAGQPGMNTWGTDQGSIFTKNFLKAFNENINQQSAESSWDEILAKSKEYTFRFTRNTTYPHYPVWEKSNCASLIEQTIVETSEPVASSLFKVTSTPRPSSMWPSRNGYHYVDFSVESPKPIDSVTYLLHYTMPKPKVTRTNSDENFRYRISVWGEFPVKAKIYYSDGNIEEQYQDIKFAMTNRRQ